MQRFLFFYSSLSSRNQNFIPGVRFILAIFNDNKWKWAAGTAIIPLTVFVSAVACVYSEGGGKQVLLVQPPKTQWVYWYDIDLGEHKASISWLQPHSSGQHLWPPSTCSSSCTPTNIMSWFNIVVSSGARMLLLLLFPWWITAMVPRRKQIATTTIIRTPSWFFFVATPSCPNEKEEEASATVRNNDDDSSASALSSFGIGFGTSWSIKGYEASK